ncbi:MAG: hypothetical protein II284_06455 [Clostridia bacterium]|nr:hypothetical protein [Clostridia bacterium]MBQ2421019.1 hypothetical protein [Clostridia bacterium]
MKRIFLLILATVMVFVFSSCGLIKPTTSMPFNGEVTFHDITITVPSDFVRDSTQSNDLFWVFEKGSYKQMIIIAQNEIDGTVEKTLDDYVNYMTEMGTDSKRTQFAEFPAVHTTYTKNDMYCQEMLFAYGNYTYAVALRGGTEEDFNNLIDSVTVKDADL